MRATDKNVAPATAARRIGLHLATVGLLALIMLTSSTIADQATDGEIRIANKLNLLKALTMNSTVDARVSTSDSQRAKALLQSARETYENAQRSFDARDFETAEELLDDGIQAVAAASRLAIDKDKETNHELHERLSERVLSFRSALVRIMKEQTATESSHQLEAVDKLISQSERLADEADYESSNRLLADAAMILERALIDARDKETLVYKIEFETLEQEFSYELKRNDSYEALIGVLMDSGRIPNQMEDYVRNALTRNRHSRDEAEALAQSGDSAAALEKLENSTEQLVKILKLSGVMY